MGKKTILIIDDETELVELLQMRLEHIGYHVRKAFNGKEGLKLAIEIIPDLIILDIKMPEMDGYEFCQVIKYEKVIRDVPIIMLTAKREEIDQIIGKAMGVADYLCKPIDHALLASKLKDLIGL